MRIDGLSLGQLEAIGAEVFGTTTEVHGRSQNLVYVVLALAGREVEGVSVDETERIRAAAERFRMASAAAAEGGPTP